MLIELDVVEVRVLTNLVGTDKVSITFRTPTPPLAGEAFAHCEISVQKGKGGTWACENFPELYAAGLVEVTDCGTGRRYRLGRDD